MVIVSICKYEVAAFHYPCGVNKQNSVKTKSWFILCENAPRNLLFETRYIHISPYIFPLQLSILIMCMICAYKYYMYSSLLMFCLFECSGFIGALKRFKI